MCLSKLLINLLRSQAGKRKLQPIGRRERNKFGQLIGRRPDELDESARKPLWVKENTEENAEAGTPAEYRRAWEPWKNMEEHGTSVNVLK